MSRVHMIFIVLLLASFARPGHGAARSPDLNTWFTTDLTPFVREQLTTHPRFRHETIKFVVMSGESPQSEGNLLVLRLRDQLRDALTRVPGIRIAWQADQAGVALVSESTAIDCTRDDAQYFIGIELTEESAGMASVQVRALDIGEHNWVAGFSKTWRGPLSTSQRRELRTIRSDLAFRGARNAPYDDSETDLMAAHLAYELGCSLLRQTAGEYIVSSEGNDTDSEQSAELIELVGNNLVGFRALQFSQNTNDTNAVIAGKAHQINDDLYQYWITVTPIDSSSSLTALSADAYIRIPDEYLAALLVPEAFYELQKADGGFLDTLRVVQLRNARSCITQPNAAFTGNSSARRVGFAQVDCYALQVRASGDAVVFFLNHQLNNGLVRLADEHCSHRATAKVARSNQALRFPLPVDALPSSAWSETNHWSLQPDRDTYYALSASDTKAARALSQHVGRLPKRCSASVRRGLEGAELRRWLEELEAIASHWASAVDWQSIRIKNVY